MNKKLITLAVGVALATPMMAAQAGPTLYGDAHGAFGTADTDSGVSPEKGNFISSVSSAWGIKGSDKLGNGLSAIYKFEWNVGLTGSNAKDATTVRDRYVGLKGSFGAVRLGYFNTAHKLTGRSVDLFYSRQLGENRALVGERAQDLRIQQIEYATPKMNGFQGKIAYSTDHDTTGGNAGKDRRTDNDDTDAFVVGANYKNAGIMLGASYQVLNDYNEEAGDPGGSDEDREGIRLVGSYKMGALKFVGMWQNVDEGANLVDQDTWGLGASYKMGNNTFKVQYYEMDESVSAAANGADLLSLGIDHHLGKKTIVYATYAQVDNEANGQNELFVGKGFDERYQNSNGNPPAPVAGGKQTGFTIGMRHRF